MLSVIIPTMWRSPYVVDLLEHLQQIECVGEVVLIDNQPSDALDISRFTKVVYKKNTTNNYVSPSWNQGYTHSMYDHLCFLNDDVIPPANVFSLVNDFIGPNVGIIGFSSDVYENILPNRESLGRAEGIRLTLCTNRNFGYGCCMFMHRDSYKIIPSDLKIQYGDDFLFYSCTKNNFVIDGFQIVGKLSGSLYDDNLRLIDHEHVSSICTSDHNFFWNVCAKQILERDPINDLDSLKLEALVKYEQKSLGNYYF